MKLDSLEQGTPVWHEFREKGIGSSEAAIILNLSEYKTPYELWCEKTGVAENAFTGNFATERGQALEPRAREHYELETGIVMKPVCFVHPKYEFMRASLDGYNEEQNIVLEIKCPHKSNHYELALKGEVPLQYMAQIQHQLLVTGAKVAHYYCFNGTEGALVKVEAMEGFQENLLDCAIKFWKCVETKTPPPLTERDYMCVSDVTLTELVRSWLQAKRHADQYTAEMERLKELITKDLPHSRVLCDGVRISTVTRKGNINYKNVPELSGVDLEQYRGKDSVFYTLSETKKGA